MKCIKRWDSLALWPVSIQEGKKAAPGYNFRGYGSQAIEWFTFVVLFVSTWLSFLFPKTGLRGLFFVCFLFFFLGKKKNQENHKLVRLVEVVCVPHNEEKSAPQKKTIQANYLEILLNQFFPLIHTSLSTIRSCSLFNHRCIWSAIAESQFQEWAR